MFSVNHNQFRFIAPRVGIGLSRLNICIRVIHRLHMRSFKSISSMPDWFEAEQETAYFNNQNLIGLVGALSDSLTTIRPDIR